ncbi:peptide/nickel transport system substrate-binding protein [Garicola koreensis]|uniref:Peptide/nickel transport system substrate-binding protein n=2 Tax=Garicola koreensis TaxID=1262554 RepID=A0A7W5TSD6_9MICC|nr:ABC transporter substrate-binding protein [Garicola koreensis]MBB3666509.1 peptide/nickel transport system substrate-binding protein [Garicola koreensis]
MRRTKKTVIAAIIAASFTLVGCSGGSSGGSPTGDNQNASIQNETVVALPEDIDNFDPHTNQLNTYLYAVRSLVFNGLVRYDASLNIEPDLATFDVNADATVFTFEIDPEAVFHDGTSVNAEAVIASFERAAGEENSIWAPRLADVASYESPDEHTVVITLNDPNAAFLAGIVDISIIAPSNFEDVDSAPVGSGPYKFVSWEANQQIELERFDNHFGEPSPTETIIYRPISDQQVALNNLYSGSIDIIASASVNTRAQVDTDRAEIIQPDASTSLSLIEFNSSGTLDDPQVRRALAHTLDKEAIQEVAYGGEGSLSYSPFAETSWAYTNVEDYEYDLQRAEDLLAEAGASDLTFTLEVPSGFPDAEQIARVWQASLAEVGVSMTPEINESSVWLDAYVSRDYDATWNVFNVGGDPHSFFDVIMTPHLDDDYDNPRMKELIAEATSTSDQAKRADIYAELQQVLVEELPVMVVQSIPVASIIADDVRGYEMNPLGWSLLDNVAVEQE